MSSRRSPRPIDWLAACCLALLPVAVAQAEEAAFDRALRGSAAHCLHAASTSCARTVFALADADRDGFADLAELERLNGRLRVWTAANAESLPAEDLRALRIGFLLVDTLGLQRIVAFYDEDGDGTLSFAEATADLTLDGRPLPHLVQSRELVDWPAVRRRFGATAIVFDYLDIR